MWKTRLPILLVVMLFMAGCSPVEDATEPAAPEFGANFSQSTFVPNLAGCTGGGNILHQTTVCGTVLQLPMKGTGQFSTATFGQAEIANDISNTYVLISPIQGLLVSEVSAWGGGTGDNPPLTSGNPDPSLYPFQDSPNPLCANYRMSYDLSRFCNGAKLSVFARFIALDQLGNPILTVDAWMAGKPLGDGFTQDFTAQSCAPYFSTCDPLFVTPGNTCNRVDPNFNQTACTVLSASTTDGTAPYSYQWSNGATTQGITVCPTVSSSYSVIITDANGRCGLSSFTVDVIDASCGNNGNKVAVCHFPPGQPNSTGNTACINPNLAPGHIGPNAHDARCFLGPCNLSPCGI